MQIFFSNILSVKAEEFFKINVQLAIATDCHGGASSMRSCTKRLVTVDTVSIARAIRRFVVVVFCCKFSF